MSKIKLTMTCEEEQLRLIMKALEEYERLRIGQADMLADSIAFDGFKTNSRDQKSRDDFDRRCDLRDHVLKSIEETIKYALIVTDKVSKCKTGEVKSIEDLWIGLRYRWFTDLLTEKEKAGRWYTVDSREPFGHGEYPLADIKLEKIEGE